MDTTDDEALIDELARVLALREGAMALLEGIGFPSQHVPEFVTASDFWRAIVDAACDEALEGGVVTVARVAAERFPDNQIFEGYLASRIEAGPTYRDRLSEARVGEDLKVRETTAPPWPGKRSAADVGHDDHLWDTGGAAALDVLGRRVPATTRGPSIIVGGRVRHQQRIVPRCPDCDGSLDPATVSIRFELAPAATAVQSVVGYRCACGSEWPDPLSMRGAHAAAFGVHPTHGQQS